MQFLVLVLLSVASLTESWVSPTSRGSTLHTTATTVTTASSTSLRDVINGSPQWYAESDAIPKGYGGRPTTAPRDAGGRPQQQQQQQQQPQQRGEYARPSLLRDGAQYKSTSSLRDAYAGSRATAGANTVARQEMERKVRIAAEKFIKYQSGYFSPMTPQDNTNNMQRTTKMFNGMPTTNTNANDNSNMFRSSSTSTGNGNNNYSNNYSSSNSNNSKMRTNRMNNNNNNSSNNNNMNNNRNGNRNNNNAIANNSRMNSNTMNNNGSTNRRNNNNMKNGRNNNSFSNSVKSYFNKGSNNSAYTNGYIEGYNTNDTNNGQQYLLRQQLSQNKERRSSILAEDFVFRTPVLGPLNKYDYIDSLVDYFRIYEAFPDINPNCYGFTVDIIDPLKVRFFVKATGTYQRPLGGFLGKAAASLTSPDGRQYVGSTEAWSVTFNDMERMQVKSMSAGYVVDRFEEDGLLTTTGGQDFVYGILNTIGLDFLPSSSPGNKSLELTQWLTDQFSQKGETGLPFLPKTSSDPQTIPQWWGDKRLGAKE